MLQIPETIENIVNLTPYIVTSGIALELTGVAILLVVDHYRNNKKSKILENKVEKNTLSGKPTINSYAEEHDITKPYVEDQL